MQGSPKTHLNIKEGGFIELKDVARRETWKHRGTPWDSPNAPQNLSVMEDSQKLILSCGYVEVGSFFIDKKRVGSPNLMDVLGSDHEIFQVWPSFKLEPFVLPKLSKVHVHCEVL